MAKYLIRAIGFSAVGEMTVEYTIPAEDFKANGLMASHSLTVPPGQSYGPALDQIVRAVELLLEEARRDLSDVPALKWEGS